MIGWKELVGNQISCLMIHADYLRLGLNDLLERNLSLCFISFCHLQRISFHLMIILLFAPDDLLCSKNLGQQHVVRADLLQATGIILLLSAQRVFLSLVQRHIGVVHR